MSHKAHKYLTFIFGIMLLISSCKSDKPSEITPDEPEKPATPAISYRVTGIIPHNTQFFTEGLLVYNGKILESTGSPKEINFTQSVIAEVDMKSGKSVEKARLDREKYFGEGIVIVGQKLYQVTYTTRKGFIYDAKTFKKTGEFTYPNAEGWGLTTEGTHVIMSDGTDKITWFLPPEMNVIKTLAVTENDFPVKFINELEWIRGYIYANIWQTNDIVKIDPASGKVVGRMNFNSLKYEAGTAYPNAQEMNGIAYDSLNDKVIVTGKLWPAYYLIDFAK